LPLFALCTDGVNISAEVLQLSGADLRFFTPAETSKKPLGSGSPQFAVCFVAACFQYCPCGVLGFLKFALRELSPVDLPRETCESLRAATGSPVGLLAPFQAHRGCHWLHLGWGSPHPHQ